MGYFNMYSFNINMYSTYNRAPKASDRCMEVDFFFHRKVLKSLCGEITEILETYNDKKKIWNFPNSEMSDKY